MSEPAPEAPSPVLPLVIGGALVAACAAAVCRLFTTGGGTELFQPGAQLLFDALALAAAAFAVLARLLAGERPLASSGRALIPLGVVVGVLALGAARAPTSDLGWRTALTATALLLLALTLRDLAARDRRIGELCLAALLGCVVGGAVLALHHYLVEIPALQAKYFAGGLDAELRGMDRSMGIAFDERIKSRQAVGPYLLPGLAATILAVCLPALGVLAWEARARRPQLAALLLVAAPIPLALALTKSKGAAVTLAGTWAVFVLLHPGLQRYRKRLFVAAGAAALLLVGVGVGALALGPERIGIGLSLTVRLEYWEAGVAMWQQHPLLGVGLNGFRDWFPLVKSLRAEETAYAHNAAIQLLADLGLVGLLAALALGVAWVWGPVRATAEDAAPEPEPKAPEADAPLGPRGLRAALVVGFALGFTLVGGFGDAYDASRFGLIVMACLVAVGAAELLRWVLASYAGDRRLLRAALLAGGAGLLTDGALNFGLNHPGVFLLTVACAALAAPLGGGPADPPLPRRAHQAAGLLPLLLAPALLLGVVPGAIAADQARLAGIGLMNRAATGEDPGRDLLAAAEAFAASCEAYPYHARTWLNLGGALRALAALPQSEGKQALREQALAATRRAIDCAPRASEARRELAELLRPDDPEAALSALDAAAALYPGHPELRLEAGRLRVALLKAGKGGPDPAQRAARARADLQAAKQASETTRLVRRRLTDRQRAELDRLLDGLSQE